MIKVSMNGMVVELDNENKCEYRDFINLISIINNNYTINIVINVFSDDKKQILLTVNEENKIIIDITNLTQFDVFRYFERKYLYNKKVVTKTRFKNVKVITKKDLIKSKEKFIKQFKENECLTNGEYWALTYMLKYIDFLINEV